MNPSENTVLTRRGVLWSAAGLSALAPVLLHSPAAHAQQERMAFADHPVVGLWINPSPVIPDGYNLFHADGTLVFHGRYAVTYEEGADPNSSVLSFGLWQPTGERTAESFAQIAFMDARVNTLWKFWSRWTVDDAGALATNEWRFDVLDPAGSVMFDGAGTSLLTRFEWEPFEPVATPEATPDQ